MIKIRELLDLQIARFDRKEDFVVFLKDVKNILCCLKSVNKKGYLNNTDIRKYPVIGEIVDFILNKEKDTEGEESSMGVGIEALYDVYKWCFSIIMLNLYRVVWEKISELKILLGDEKNEEIAAEYDDILSDFVCLSRDIFMRIDPSIRVKLVKRGMSILSNIYTGMDGEWVQKRFCENQHLSMQLAISTRLVLKIPVESGYSLSNVGTINGQVYELVSKHGCINYSELVSIVNREINSIRLLRFEKYDLSMNILIKGLKNYMESKPEEGIKRSMSVGRDFVIFSFPHSPIKRWIKLLSEKGIGLVDIVKQSNSLCISDLTKEYKRVISLLESLHKNWVDLVDSYNGEEYRSELVSLRSLLLTLDNPNPLNDITKENVYMPEILFEPMKKLPVMVVDERGENGSVVVDSVNKANDVNAKDDLNIMVKSRRWYNSFSFEKISVTSKVTNYIVGHYTAAEMGMFTDFNDWKDKLSLVKKSFVTLSRPLVIDNVQVVLRDTYLLSPAGKSLSAIGDLYNQEEKLELGLGEIECMDKLLDNDKNRFIDYAIQDAVIPLLHMCYMEECHMSVGYLGVPLTVSSLGTKQVKYVWGILGYRGYQITPLNKIGDNSKTFTPKGLFSSGKVGYKLPLYIGNYKGGRNESYMYGCDTSKTEWYDFDLTSAYTTAMAGLGNPDYRRSRILTIEELSRMSNREIVFSYIIIKGSFEFPENVKYPSIPVFVDETTTIYPLRGDCILTGSEYLVAKKQGAKIEIDEIFYIPFETTEVIVGKNASGGDIIEKVEINHPFRVIIKSIQRARGIYPKGSLANIMEKLRGNGIYGSTSRGIGYKAVYDIGTRGYTRVECNDLSNPIIASWTTAFIRSVVGEMLHRVQSLGGRVVSCTTDGFITDLPNLENLVLNQIAAEGDDFSMLLLYRKLRFDLSGKSDGLELKKSVVGLTSWTTRGQYSQNGIAAMTGFQRGSYNTGYVGGKLVECLGTDEKSIEYIQTSLRGGLDIFKEGGHVTMKYKDQVFRLHHDNRRVILDNSNSDVTNNDICKGMLDSKPVPNIEYCRVIRGIVKMTKSSSYNRLASISVGGTKYKSYSDIAIRCFVKNLFTLSESYNINREMFSTYRDIITFIKDFDPMYRISKSSLSHLKNRIEMTRIKTVPKNGETISFVTYVKSKFPCFNDMEFFR